MKEINNNISEDYCSFEVSKLLKEKGFDCQCNLAHISGEKYGTTTDLLESGYGLNVCTNSQIQENKDEYGWTGYIKDKEIVMKPTHSLTIKWIRENFGMHIFTDFGLGWEAYIIPVGYQGEAKFDNGSTQIDRHNSPEEATEAALINVLKYLI